MSTVRCLVCHKESRTFDTFSNLTLPLPSNASRCTLQVFVRLQSPFRTKICCVCTYYTWLFNNSNFRIAWPCLQNLKRCQEMTNGEWSSPFCKYWPIFRLIYKACRRTRVMTMLLYMHLQLHQWVRLSFLVVTGFVLSADNEGKLVKQFRSGDYQPSLWCISNGN